MVKMLKQMNTPIDYTIQSLFTLSLTYLQTRSQETVCIKADLLTT